MKGIYLEKIRNIFLFMMVLILLFNSISKAESNMEFNKISGRNRYATSVEISKDVYESSDNVVLASGDDFPDALSATSLASTLNCPILLVSKNSISKEVIEEIERLNASKIYIIGGKSTITESNIDGLNGEKIRISGSNRYETNNLVINEIAKNNGKSGGYIVVTGENYPDSVVAVGISINKDYPIKIVNKTIEDEYNLDGNYIVGGKSSVNISNLKGERISGSNRYLTSLELAKRTHPRNDILIITTGENYADALSSVSLSKKYNAPIILSENIKMNNKTMEYIKNDEVKNITIAGASVNDNVLEILRKYINGEEIVEYFKPISIPMDIREKMKNNSLPSNSKISFEELVYIPIQHYDFNENILNGGIVVNKKVGEEVGNIFKELFNIKYKIEKVKLIDEYGADDNKSMADNNSSSFNYRLISGTNRLSKHAQGLAIDINPLYNPYIKNGIAIPSVSQKYVDRSLKLESMIYKNDKIYNIFSKYGWKWGGNWTSPDYQHFEK